MKLNSRSANVLRFSLGLALVLAAIAAPAYAQGQTNPGGVPEVGLGSIGSAVTLLSGGYFVVTSRLRRKK